MERQRYPILTVPTDGQTIHPSTVDVDSLTEQLVPIRNALLKLFQKVPARSRGELKELELGLCLTTGGQVAFVSSNVAPSIMLRLGSTERRTSVARPSSPPTFEETPQVVEVT